LPESQNRLTKPIVDFQKNQLQWSKVGNYFTSYNLDKIILIGIKAMMSLMYVKQYDVVEHRTCRSTETTFRMQNDELNTRNEVA